MRAEKTPLTLPAISDTTGSSGGNGTPLELLPKSVASSSREAGSAQRLAGIARPTPAGNSAPTRVVTIPLASSKITTDASSAGSASIEINGAGRNRAVATMGANALSAHAPDATVM